MHLTGLYKQIRTHLTVYISNITYSSRTDGTIKSSILFVIFIILVHSILGGRGLYADGSYFLLEILSNKSILSFDKPRIHAVALTQLPLWISIKLGYRDLNGLILLHSASLIGPTLIAWIFALMIHFNSNFFWHFVILFTSIFLTSGFFPVGEYNITYALSALCLALLLKEKLRLVGLIFLIFLSLILIRSYEAMVFLGPMLCSITIWRSLDKHSLTSLWMRYGFSVAALGFASSFFVALWSITHPRDPSNLIGAANSAYLFRSEIFLLTLLVLIMYVALHLDLRRATKACVSALAIFFSAIFFLNASQWLAPGQHYLYRSVASAVFLIVCCSIFFLRNLQDNAEKQSFFVVLVAGSFFLSLSAHFLNTSIRYYDWMKNYEAAVIGTAQWLPFENIISKDNSPFGWNWSNPSLSIVLRGNHYGGALNSSSYLGWQPFDVLQLDKNPLIDYRKDTFFYEQQP